MRRRPSTPLTMRCGIGPSPSVTSLTGAGKKSEAAQTSVAKRVLAKMKEKTRLNSRAAGVVRRHRNQSLDLYRSA